MKERIQGFRKIQTIASIFCFIIIFFLCWYVTQFNIKDIPLSKLGINEKIKNLWNFSVVLVSISMFINISAYVFQHLVVGRKFLRVMIGIICVFLAGTAIIDMNTLVPHSLSAVLYFIGFPIFIFLLSFLNRKHILISEWKHHIKSAITMIIIPLICLYSFKGLAICELTHAMIVMYWNISIMKYYKT